MAPGAVVSTRAPAMQRCEDMVSALQKPVVHLLLWEVNEFIPDDLSQPLC